jgi:membrane-bound ClpP family serine protease
VVVPVVGVVVAVFVLPPGWGAVLLVAVIVWEAAEKLFWIRLIGRYPVVVGREAMIGMSVIATTACWPEGRVRFQGENWQARCSMGARPGETLVVEGVERITLIVGRAPHVGGSRAKRSFEGRQGPGALPPRRVSGDRDFDAVDAG